MLRRIRKEDFTCGCPIKALYLGYSRYLDHSAWYNVEYIPKRNKIKIRKTINPNLRSSNFGCEWSLSRFFIEEEHELYFKEDDKMGFRMKIRPVGKNTKIVGGDHKFYGYAPYDVVSESFSFLWRVSYLHNNFVEADFKKAYEKFALEGTAGPFSLSPVEFRRFTDLYLVDLARSGASKEDVACVESYMSEMEDLKEYKIVWWE